MHTKIEIKKKCFPLNHCFPSKHQQACFWLHLLLQEVFTAFIREMNPCPVCVHAWVPRSCHALNSQWDFLRTCSLKMSEFPHKSSPMSSKAVIPVISQSKGPTATAEAPNHHTLRISCHTDRCLGWLVTILSPPGGTGRAEGELSLWASCYFLSGWGCWRPPFSWYFSLLASGPRWKQEKQRSVKNKNIFSVVTPTFLSLERSPLDWWKKWLEFRALLFPLVWGARSLNPVGVLKCTLK